MKRLKVHVLYEYGKNFRPHASSSLRLLRPLTHPALLTDIEVTVGRSLGNETPDAVLVDRLWRPDIHPAQVVDLANEVHSLGAKLIYWFDDHFLLLNDLKPVRPEYLVSFQKFLELSDSLVVSTAELKNAFQGKSRIFYLPSALDERLIVRKSFTRRRTDKITIGYMGSSTHDDDLRIVVPAMQCLNKRYPDQLRFQIVGALDQEKLENFKEMQHLPIQISRPMPMESEYPAFMLWFTGEMRWDIAIAPLVDNEFNRYKSDIKFLDYAAAGAPGIFSRVSAYRDTVVHNQTGLLITNDPRSWIEAMQELIEDEPLRVRLAMNAIDYLYKDRVLANCAVNWLSILNEVVRK